MPTDKETIKKDIEDIKTFMNRKDGWFNAVKMEIYRVTDKYKEFGNQEMVEDIDEIDAAFIMLERRLSQKIDELETKFTEQVEEARLLGKLDVAKEFVNKIGDSTCHDIGAAIRYADSLLKKYQKQYLTNLRKEQNHTE